MWQNKKVCYTADAYPIFIVGVPRSGTTLLAAMMSAHSRICCGSETHFFKSDALSYTVRYEVLVLSPENELRRLCDFISEKFETAMLDTTESLAHVNRTNEPWEKKVETAIDVSRISVWRRELTEDQSKQAECLIGDRLRAYGYHTNEHFNQYGFVYPLKFLSKYPEVLTSIARRGVRFYGIHTKTKRIS